MIYFDSLIALLWYYYNVTFYVQFAQMLSLNQAIAISPFSLVYDYKICSENSLYLTLGNQWTFILALCICIIFFCFVF